ncbi:MAG: glycosyltransferase, partial [Erysipelotrichaceae bacterium]|nr:glycosyltransferase [Erysipelotrichaceae bacterium]
MTATFKPGNEKVLAGIVLYNPDPDKLEDNIRALAGQTDRIVLVDNSPDPNSEICRLQDKYGLILISNGRNLGVAKGLNQILEYADTHGYKWYLTMDQDSLVADDLIHVFFENADENTGILCPFLLNNKKISMEEYLKMDLCDRMEITDPIRCITSASLNRTEAALQAGGYLDDLFIDCVDVEFNIRMMEA